MRKISHRAGDLATGFYHYNLLRLSVDITGAKLDDYKKCLDITEFNTSQSHNILAIKALKST